MNLPFCKVCRYHSKIKSNQFHKWKHHKNESKHHIDFYRDQNLTQGENGLANNWGSYSHDNIWLMHQEDQGPQDMRNMMLDRIYNSS